MSFLDQFLDWAHSSLTSDDDASSYLMGRGISRDQFSRHRLGYVGAPFLADPALDPGHGSLCSDKESRHLWCDVCRFNRWSTLWEEVEEGAPKVKRPGMKIVGCVVFPLTSYSGGCVGFQVRSTKEKAYDSFSVRRRPEAYFFGTSQAMSRIWSTGEVWVTEGPGDDLVMERLVEPNVIGLTTSAASVDQLRFFRRFARTVNLCLDLDGPGREGVKSMRERLGPDCLVRDFKYPKLRPKDKDPGDFWKSAGDKAFADHFRRMKQELI